MPADMMTQRDRLIEMYRERVTSLTNEMPGMNPVDAERARHAIAFGKLIIGALSTDAFVTPEGVDLAEAGMYFMTMGGWIHADHIRGYMAHYGSYRHLARTFLVEADGGWMLSMTGWL